MQTFSTKTIFPPYPPHWPYPGGTFPPLRLPASRLGCLALGAAAGFALIRNEDQHGNLRPLPGGQTGRKKTEDPVQPVQVRFARGDLTVCQPGFLTDHLVIVHQRREGRELGGPVMQAHVPALFRLMMGEVDDVRVDLARIRV